MIAQADQAMASGDLNRAASLLELAAQRGRDATTLLRLATVRRALGDITGAQSVAAAAVELAPRNFLMLMLLGSLREATGALASAVRAYRQACQYAPVDTAFQPRLRDQLGWARRCVAAEDAWRQRLFDWRPAGALEAMSADEVRRIRGFRNGIIDNLDIGPLAPTRYMVPGIAAAEFFEPADFAGVSAMEQATGAIRDEFLGLASTMAPELAAVLTSLDQPQPDPAVIGKWSMIPLIRNGERVDKFASLCPLTMQLFDGLDAPRLGLISPSLYFSLLGPHSRIAPHSGITNARVIAHWPLIVRDGCGLRVGKQTRRWVPGTALLFDDMTEHEAWNDGDWLRVVLIADLWRPELSELERAAVSELMDRRLAI